jgi:hypothetical protein
VPIPFEFSLAHGYFSVMARAILYTLVFSFLLALPAWGATGRVVKVLPEYLDREGRTSLSPSLYERDAYQAELRKHPDRRSGLRYYVEWKMHGAVWEPLKLRLELRGVAQANLPKQLVLEQELINKRTRFTRWAQITLTPDQYRRLGEVTAWRVTLWEGANMISEQKSFLW